MKRQNLQLIAIFRNSTVLIINRVSKLLKIAEKSVSSQKETMFKNKDIRMYVTLSKPKIMSILPSNTLFVLFFLHLLFHYLPTFHILRSYNYSFIHQPCIFINLLSFIIKHFHFSDILMRKQPQLAINIKIREHFQQINSKI